MKYTSKKIHTVDAVQFIGNTQAIIDFVNDASVVIHEDRDTIRIKHRGGISWHVVEPTDYLVREASGYLHAVKQDVFEQIYSKQ